MEELEKLYSRGYYLYETGNFPGAIEVFQGLITIDPNYLPYLQGLAASLQMNQEYYRAIHCWSMVINLNPTELNAYVHLAESLLSIQATGLALQVLQKAKELSSQSPEGVELELRDRMALLESCWRNT